MGVYNYKMLCYKDKSFCSSSPHCGVSSCYRYLSRAGEEKATELGLLVSYSSFHGTEMCKASHAFCDCGGILINELCNYCGYSYKERK